jgi:hypothetical protein
MRLPISIILLLVLVQPLAGQEFQTLTFYDQPVLEQGISIEPYALFYENPAGDTAQPLSEVAQQQFIPIASTSDTKFNNARQMKQTSQSIQIKDYCIFKFT